MISFSPAAHHADNGDIETPFDINRNDELGEIARSFQKLQTRLTSDRLTGLANRETFRCRIPDDSIQKSRFPLFFAREVLKGLIEPLASESVVAGEAASEDARRAAGDAASPARRALSASHGVPSSC